MVSKLFSIVIVAGLYLHSATAAAQQACEALWAEPTLGGGQGVLAIVADIPLTATWASLAQTTKSKLQELADARLVAYRARWSGDALAKKQTVLLECPSLKMQAAIDEFYVKFYDTVVPKTFSVRNIGDRAFASVLVRHYLGTVAALRAGLTYPDGKLPNRDWDGKSLFDSVRLPDEKASTDIGQFNAELLADLMRIDDRSLTDSEKTLRNRVLFDARSNAVSVFDGIGYKRTYWSTPCALIERDWDVLAGYELDKGRPRIFASDDHVLSEVNAIYLHNIAPTWVDVGTLASAVKYCNATDADFVKERVGDPATNAVAKGMVQIKNWWIERLSRSAAAESRCTVYTPADRAVVWEAFSSAQLFNNDASSSMETYRSLLANYVEKKRSEYRDAARLALGLVFPDAAVLTGMQRRQALASIEAEGAFGMFPELVARVLDAAQGTSMGPAAQKWRAIVASSVVRVGGGYSEQEAVRHEDEGTIKTMFEEVKAWLAHRYRGYPIEIAALYPKIPFEVSTDNNAFTYSGGKIRIGVGTARSKMEYYSLLIHELRHAVYRAWQANAPDPAKVKTDDGPVLEGSGVAAEALLLPEFLKQILNDDTAYALNVLDYGIRDARFAATTDATLQRYFRPGCSDERAANTIDFVKSIAEGYGLTGKLADNLAIRSHADTQYFQYIWGGLQVLDDIAFLQSQIDTSGSRRIDPFVLFACGLNTPRRDAGYVNELRACVVRQ